MVFWFVFLIFPCEQIHCMDRGSELVVGEQVEVEYKMCETPKLRYA
jgi:hypothetical protein